MPPDLMRIQRVPRELARWQQAQKELMGGRHQTALVSYRDLVQRYPGVVQLWFEMGMAAAAQLDFDLADQAFRRALELVDGDVSALVLIGQQYQRLRRLDRARTCFERAAAADPNSIHAQLSLAVWYEWERRLEDAWQCAERCLVRHPSDPQVLCVRALLLHRKGENTDAESLLRDLIKRSPQDPNVRYSARHMLGVVLDKLGNYPEAFRWLCEAKAQLRQMTNTTVLQQEYDRADRRRRDLLGKLNRQTIERWRADLREEPGSPALALLAGHPRSGTTLLEQVLGAHPEIRAFDESEAFVQEISEQLSPMRAQTGPALEAISNLPLNRQTELRRRYFKSLLRESDKSGGRVLLDKNPSITGLMHLWLRLFPGAKVVVALRDPRDVVLSCFFQNLTLTSTNANFLSIDGAARHYADLMDVWLKLREFGGFDFVETRYEDVVKNLEPEGRRVTEFLGLNWHVDQANHRELGSKKVLFAPTYNDVTKPLHSKSIGRWQRYADALGPIQEKLAPYCKAFGYSLP